MAKAEQALGSRLHDLAVKAALEDPRSYEDVAYSVQCQTIQKISDDASVKERIDNSLRKLKAQLSGPAPTPLESLLIERILTCWLEVNWYDFLYVARKDCTIQQADHYQRRQDRAHKRYLSAVKALAQVRRLELPAVQVNIGQNQVNTQAVLIGTSGK